MSAETERLRRKAGGRKMKTFAAELAKLKDAFEFFLTTLLVTFLVVIFVACWLDIETDIIAVVDGILGGF